MSLLGSNLSAVESANQLMNNRSFDLACHADVVRASSCVPFISVKTYKKAYKKRIWILAEIMLSTVPTETLPEINIGIKE